MEVKDRREEKKGSVKITIEIEINEPLMLAMKEMMEKMPPMMMARRRAREEEHHEERKEPEKQ
jgi:hypothetical protein